MALSDKKALTYLALMNLFLLTASNVPPPPTGCCFIALVSTATYFRPSLQP